MQSPSLFDDVYDSDISLNYSEYERARLLEYCIRCEIDVKEAMETPELANALMQTIADMINSTGNIDSLFKSAPATKNEDLSNQCFLLELKNQLYKGKDLGESLRNAIVSDFNRYLQYLQDSFRATCFATTPYSQLMWGGSYADCHRGFCVEYTVLPNDAQYQKLFLNITSILKNLFLFPPAFYSVALPGTSESGRSGSESSAVQKSPRRTALPHRTRPTDPVPAG